MMKTLACIVFFVVAASYSTMGSPVKAISEKGLEMASPLEDVGCNFERDIELITDQGKVVKYTFIGDSFRWSNNYVPFSIDRTAFTISQQQSIMSAFQQIELVSCVRFKPRTTEKDYIKVQGAHSDCWARIDRRGGPQTINLLPNRCIARGTIIHELLHALGFVHMQSVSDSRVMFKWSLTQADKASNFDRYGPTVVDDFGLPYDYESVMNY